jgi:hypothetical protein
MNAGRGYSKDRIKCICPSALAAVAARNKAQKEYENNIRKNVRNLESPLPRWWSGPWAISKYCPTEEHHTLRAAFGRLNGSSTRTERCICPRAIARREAHSRQTSAYAKSKRSVTALERASLRDQQAAGFVKTNRAPVVDPMGMRKAPDWRHGLCSKDLATADGGFDDAFSHKGYKLRHAAKELCVACPLLAACGRFVTANEEPAGSWGGVWGGMDPANRRGYKDVILNGNLYRVPLDAKVRADES